MKKKILFVGMNPFATSGTSAMMHAVLYSLDGAKYSATCFCVDPPTIEWASLLYSPLPFSIIPANDGKTPQSLLRLYQVIMHGDHDAVVFVGVDIWEYLDVLRKLSEIHDKPFKIAAIFPYDLQAYREDWAAWINLLDFPCVYSKYGYDIMKLFVPKLRYFRPPLKNPKSWKPVSKQERLSIRKKLFPTIESGDLVFGFVGRNQKRKDPLGLIDAFAIAHKQCPNLYLFMHTDFNGRYNLVQYIKDRGIPPALILKKPDSHQYLSESMPKLYNSFDALINCAVQEGLSLTPIEAMLCGVPVIASESTAHIEIVKDSGILVPCNLNTTIRVITESGPANVKAKKCNPVDTAKAMVMLAQDKKLRKYCIDKGLKKSRTWLKAVSDPNVLLDEMCRKEVIAVRKEKRNREVLFVQRASAGDVFMTTRCFKGIKERYKKPLHYMTSPQYMDIVTNNPYLDMVIPWSENMMHGYIVINPHGERIGPGHWGRNSNSLLSDFYWKILDVEPDDFFIELQKPPYLRQQLCESDKSICILHTTGGDPHYRTYKFMKDVHDGLGEKYLTIQLGGKHDYPAGADVDFRGRLSFRETAWVMSKAAIAVTVDSFISHLSGALGVPQVCLFGSGNYNVVRPNQVKGKLICRTIDYALRCKGLGPCSGSVKDCPATCTGMHDPKDILADIKELDDSNDVVVKISE